MKIVNYDGLFYMAKVDCDCVFADPPDNIGLSYGEYDDNLDEDKYEQFLSDLVHHAMASAPIVWISFNARWLPFMGGITHSVLKHEKGWRMKPCVQTFTFGQYQENDFGNCYRPLWRFYREDATFYPEHIKVESERQKMGDKRANPKGRTPSDVFDFPRVTGNSKQRRKWHPTQLHEGLVERCILFSTPPGGKVIDPFAGSGTTGRVCKRIGRDCDLLEIDADYCRRMSEELEVPIVGAEEIID